MKKTGIAVVGYGGMGGWHCRKISEIEELELIGIYDVLDSRNAAAEGHWLQRDPAGRPS